MSTTSRVLVAALAGVAIGAVAGLLLAPEAGEDLRNRLAEKAKDAKDGLLNKLETGLSSLNGLKDNVLSQVQDASNEINHKAGQAKQQHI